MYVKMQCDSFYSMSALKFASLKGHADVVQLLLDTKEVDINEEYDNGDTPLNCASREGDLSTIKILLQNGANVNHKSKRG